MKQSLAHPDWPYICDRFCKVHYYWNFETERHEPLPTSYNVKSSAGWRSQVVFCGPPGYLPRKPTKDQWEAMERECVHTQADLTCNTCLRHVFHPLEL
jgi:hypothetical protein